MSVKPSNYQVLARKYRPQNFDHLVGQDSLVRTISNAIKMDRLAHAFLLTGIRGIGKTTTARIIAKSINCTNIDKTKAVIQHCGICNNCLAFANHSHPDIIEMDAASRTGINDVREIIENANYLPLMGKFKIYIIDEVHMLSNSAFNALLKTLEEPPAHVKFIFATTEIKKIPVTVLSRCQKFDLKRLSNNGLIQHLTNIASNENIQVEQEALSIIAAQAEGSVRDSLSLFDQAIAHSLEATEQKVTAQIIRNMLGLSNKDSIYNLFEQVINSDAKAAINLLGSLYHEGADPLATIESLLEVIHFCSKIKLIPELVSDITIAESERSKANELASKLDLARLTTMWQITLKAIYEIRSSPSSMEAAEMSLIRLCYSAGLPSPIDLIKNIKKNQSPPENKPVVNTPSLAKENLVEAISSFKQLVDLFKEKKELLLHHYLNEDVHLVSFEPGKIEFRPTEHAPKDLAGKLSSCLAEWTGKRWVIVVSNQEGNDTISGQKIKLKEIDKKQSESLPLTKAILDNFPGSSIIDVRDIVEENIIFKEQSNG